MYPVAILAGGLATRLRPITETIPKALINVAGQPFIIRQLSYLRDQGIKNVVLCVGYLGSMIQDVVGDGGNFGINVSYSYDGDVLLGTGGAIKNALPFLGERFFILYGDSFLPINFSEVQQKFDNSKSPALMTILENKNFWDKSNVLFRDGVLLEYNKRVRKSEMSYIDYGLGLVSSSIFSKYDIANSFDLSDVYHELSMNGNLVGLEVFKRFYEIGSHSGLLEAEEYFLVKENL